jgi:protein TonB
LSRADADAEIAAERKEQAALLSQIRRDIAAMPPNDPVVAQKLRLLAAIEKRVNEEGGYPRRRYVSPGTTAEPYASYYRALSCRIEDRGTQHFPSSNGHHLYGELTLNITVDAQGRVIATEVVHGSGDTLLDRKASEIARSAGPFDRFSEAMRKEADEIVTTARFHFVRRAQAAEGEASGSGTSRGEVVDR